MEDVGYEWDEDKKAYVCTGCSAQAGTEQGARSHQTRKHPSGPTADEMFALVGKATEALFPNGIPAARVIEIAELQRAMMKVLAR